MILNRRTVTFSLSSLACSCLTSQAFSWPRSQRECGYRKPEYAIDTAQDSCEPPPSESNSIISRASLNVITDSKYDNYWSFINIEIDIMLRLLIDVRPNMMSFDDGSLNNAYAVPQNIARDCGSYGTVLVGQNLVKSVVEESENDWKSVLSFIIGHEYAHITQFTLGRMKTLAETEIHADLISGWCAARTNVHRRKLYSVDYDSVKRRLIKSPAAGNSSSKRVAAFVAGVELASVIPNFREAFEVGGMRVRAL